MKAVYEDCILAKVIDTVYESQISGEVLLRIELTCKEFEDLLRRIVYIAGDTEARELLTNSGTLFIGKCGRLKCGSPRHFSCKNVSLSWSGFVSDRGILFGSNPRDLSGSHLNINGVCIQTNKSYK